MLSRIGRGRGGRVPLPTHTATAPSLSLSLRLSLDGLGVTHVLAPEAELLGQLVHHVLEDDRVHVLAEQVEEEPVAHHRLLDDDVQALGLDPSKPARQRSTSMHVKTKINYIYGNDRLIRSIGH